MSYEIIFDKQFIKVKDKLLPFIYGGSTNCTELTSSNRQRIARDWFIWSVTNNSILSTEKEMLDSADETLKIFNENCEDGMDYLKKTFGSYLGLAIGSRQNSPNFNQFKNIFKNGCSKAIDIETLVRNYGYLSISTMRYAGEKLKEANLEPFNIVIKTEEEFLSVYNEKKEIYGDTITVKLHLHENQPKRIRKEILMRKKELISQKP